MFDPAPHVSFIYRLTSREREVCCLIADTHGGKEIAARLGIAYNTVEEHLRQIHRKLQVKNRVQLVRVVLESGLLNSGQSES